MSIGVERKAIEACNLLAALSEEECCDAVAALFRGRAEDAGELDYRARLATALREFRLWPPLFRKASA